MIYHAERALDVGRGVVQAGELYPSALVTPSLLALSWVRGGPGPLPADERTHALFTPAELAEAGED